MSTVFLVPMKAADGEADVATKIDGLWRAAGFDDVFGGPGLAALKLHVGEPGTRTFVKPKVVRPFVDLIAETGARPFLTDTAVLYRSPRDNGVGHVAVAEDHGFSREAMGAPFIPADGIRGSDALEVEIDGGRHFSAASIASAILQANSMLVLTHATGHLGTGFGGALKNLGMGCCSKKGKLRQHHGQEPRIDPDTCSACEVCAEWCPTEAISVDATATIDSSSCIGCGECVAACQEGAVTFDWQVNGRQLQERVVEHAAAVVRSKPGRIAYVTAAFDITKNCDCLGMDESPVVEDIGLLASYDPVAVDQAVLDLVREQAGDRLETFAYPQHDASIQLEYAERMGIGERNVDLVRIEMKNRRLR